MRISDWSSDVCSSDLKDYVIFDAALDRCDEVHVSRHGFLKQSSTLLEQFCRKKGRLNQTLSSLFQAQNITLAQSGGMQTTIRLVKNGRQLGQALTSNLHVKDGDGTTPHAAPRIYFQHLDKDDQFRRAEARRVGKEWISTWRSRGEASQ